MALIVRDFYVLKITFADDSQGRQTRNHSVGIVRDTDVPETEDPWATILANINAYLTVIADISDAVVIGWNVSRSAVWDGSDINAPGSADNERKAVVPAVDTNGRKLSLEIPSLDEDTLLASGLGEGLYQDGTDAAVIAYLAALVSGDYCAPRDGVVFSYASPGKKFHRTSGVLKERVG